MVTIKAQEVAQLSRLLNKAATYSYPYVEVLLSPKMCGTLADLLARGLLDGVIEIEKEEDN